MPYEFVAGYAEQLFEQIVSVPQWETTFYLEQYYLFLSACGWTDQALDREMLHRVDITWDVIARSHRNIKSFFLN